MEISLRIQLCEGVLKLGGTVWDCERLLILEHVSHDVKQRVRVRNRDELHLFGIKNYIAFVFHYVTLWVTMYQCLLLWRTISLPISPKLNSILTSKFRVPIVGNYLRLYFTVQNSLTFDIYWYEKLYYSYISIYVIASNCAAMFLTVQKCCTRDFQKQFILFLAKTIHGLVIDNCLKMYVSTGTRLSFKILYNKNFKTQSDLCCNIQFQTVFNKGYALGKSI